ncbi:MAG TPA: hypothetical protein VKW06_02430 [Candidatus Angelobacter sp.]|nr:hypothetical protein [Candidatus Angelobacter sp.]
MRLSWIILTALFLGAAFYLGRESATTARPSAAQDQSPDEKPGSHRLAESMQRKLDHLRANAALAQPDQTPTILTEEEVNAYFASGMVELPQGVKKVSLQGKDGVVTGLITVNFDEIRAGQKSSNPLLALFSGTHNVRVDADASGSGGQGKVHARNVNIDGIDVPAIALQFFLEKYVTPKYPGVGIDSHFALPEKIDTATVGYHKLILTQK